MKGQHGGRHAGLLRVLTLLQRTQRGMGLRYAPSLRALAEEFAVDPRTIRRDFQLLERAGFRVPTTFREVTRVPLGRAS